VLHRPVEIATQSGHQPFQIRRSLRSLLSTNLELDLGHINEKPNPPKDGDGKPQVLASSEKPRNDSPKDPKTAELPKYN